MADDKVGEVYLDFDVRVAKGEPAATVKQVREKIERAKPAMLRTEMKEITSSQINTLVASAKARLNGKLVELNTVLKAPAAAQIAGVRKTVKEELGDVTARIGVEVSPAQVVAEIRKAIKQAVIPAVKVQVDIERVTAAQVEQAISAARNLKTDIDLNVHANTGLARSQLAEITRDRMVSVTAVVRDSGLAKASKALAGGNIFGHMLDGASDLSRNLDTVAVSFSTAALKGAMMGAMLTGISGHALAFVGSLKAIAPAALAIPGLLAGIGVGGYVAVKAFQDMQERMSWVGDEWAKTVEAMTNASWERASGPINELANNLLPVLHENLTAIGSEMGGVFAAIANAAGSEQSLKVIDGALQNIRESIDIAGDGWGALASGIIRLTGVGTAYLPALSSAFNEAMYAFEDWVNTATDTGEIFQWIDNGLAALSTLGSLIGSVTGILGGLISAATAAGGAGLGAIAEGAERINKAINGPVWQGTLEAVFRGAYDAISNLSPGIGALGDAFIQLAPTISQIMSLAGMAVSNLLTGVSSALSNPIFAGGMEQLFLAIVDATAALYPAFDSIGQKVGEFAALFGVVITTIAPLVTQIITGLVPAFSDLMVALQPVVQAIGSALSSALSFIIPLVAQVIGWFASLIQQFPGLSAGVALVAAGIGILAPIFGVIVSAITSVIGIVSGLMAAWTAVSGAFTAVTGTISGLSLFLDLLGLSLTSVLAPVLAVVAGIGVLVAGLAYAMATSEEFRAAVAGLIAAIGGLIAPIVGALLPVIQQIAGAFMGLVQTVMNALVPLFTTIVQIVTQVIAILTPLVTWLMSVLAPVFQFIADAVSAAFTYIGQVISAAVAFINSILQVFLAVLQGDWSGAWNALGGVLTAAWELIKSIVIGGIQFVGSIISAGLSMVQGVFSAIWNGISAVVSGAWSAISGLVSAGISAVVSFISSGMSNALAVVSSILSSIQSFFSTVWNGIVSFISGAISSIVSGVSSGFSSVVSAVSGAMSSFVSTISGAIGDVLGFFGSLPGKIIGAIGDAGSMLLGVGRNIIQGLIGGIKSMAGAVGEAISGVVGGVKEKAMALLGIHSPSRVFKQYGVYTGEGYQLGLEKQATPVRDAVRDMLTVPDKADVPAIPAPSVPSFGPVPVPASALTSAPAAASVSSPAATTAVAPIDYEALAAIIDSRPVTVVVEMDSREIAKANTVGGVKNSRR